MNDKFLDHRYKPNTPTGLADRIILAAQAEQLSFLHEMTLWLVLPKPGFSLAVMLVLGLVFGLQVDTLAGLDVGIIADPANFTEEDIFFYLNEEDL